MPTVFSKNRDRLMEGDIAQKFFDQVLEQATAAGLVSDEHFSVDGTLIEAWASQKSFQRKDRTKEPRKGGGQESKLAYCGNAMIENRNGLVVDTELLQAGGTAERDAALPMVDRIESAGRVTAAGDKRYDTRDFVAQLRSLNATPHVAQNEKRPGGMGRWARLVSGCGE